MNNLNKSSSSKLGRKGDPRMHRAVAARLANPDLSLFEALRIGGFEYPTNDEASIVDNEKVTLGQRKNQLSRRLRLARKQPVKEGYPDSQDGDESSGSAQQGTMQGQRRHTVGSPSLSREQAHHELQKLMETSTSDKDPATNSNRALHLKRQFAEIGGLSDEDVDGEHHNEIQPEDPPKGQRMAKFHPDYAPLFLPPGSSVRNSFNAPSVAAKANGGATPGAQHPSQPQQGFAPAASPVVPGVPALGLGVPYSATLGAGNPTFSQASLLTHQLTGGFPTQPTPQPRASSVAISSLTHSAQSVGMTLEQLAMALASDTLSLSKLLAEGKGGDAEANKQELALRLFATESKGLYTKCMLMAGIDPRDCQPSSQRYGDFAMKAWQMEGQRLQETVGGSGTCEAPLGHAQKAVGQDTGADEGEACKEDHDHHGTAQKRPGCGGRHVHRIDGQCGHKAIIHKPKDGGAHIDFVVGNKVECYHGIEPLGNKFDTAWPSRYSCQESGDNCPETCLKEIPGSPEPKIFPLSEINLQDPEWNYDVNGSIDGGVMGLFQLGGRTEDPLATV